MPVLYRDWRVQCLVSVGYVLISIDPRLGTMAVFALGKIGSYSQATVHSHCRDSDSHWWGTVTVSY